MGVRQCMSGADLHGPSTVLQVHHPIDYARVVQRISNEMDLTLVNLDDILPAATVMVRVIRRAMAAGGREARGQGGRDQQAPFTL